MLGYLRLFTLVISLLLTTHVWGSHIENNNNDVEQADNQGMFILLDQLSFNHMSSFLDIRDLTRLEETSAGMAWRVNGVTDYPTIKRVQVPYVYNVPYAQLFLAHQYYVEFCIARWRGDDAQGKQLADTVFVPFYIESKEWLTKAADLQDKRAVKLKWEGLQTGAHHYTAERNADAARAFLDGFVARGHTRALQIARNCYRFGLSGYPLNKYEARRLNAELVAQGNLNAISLEYEGLMKGGEGYTQDIIAARMLNDQLVAAGHKEAILRKLSSLSVNSLFCGYEQNLEGYRNFNEELIAKGDQAAMVRKVSGLLAGKNGYAQDLDAARQANERLVALGNENGLVRKLQGLYCGFDGYAKDEGAARALWEQITRDDKLSVKINLLAFNDNVNHTCRYGLAIKTLNEALVDKGNPHAILAKLNGLYRGTNGYSQDIKAMVAFNDQLVAQGNQIGIRRKKDGLLHGQHGYAKDKAGSTALMNDKLIVLGDESAIQDKISGLRSGSFGYGKNLEALKHFLTELAEKGHRKAINELKKIDVDKACELSRKWQIPLDMDNI